MCEELTCATWLTLLEVNERFNVNDWLQTNDDLEQPRDPKF